MTTVAEVLKQERETQGISLEEVAQKTYIKLHYLHALEEDRPDLLPAPVYTCGYIRQYAKLLGLNGADLVNIYQSQHKPREYSIVRNVSPALAPETKIEPRPVDVAEEVEAVPAAVRHTEPVEAPVSRPAVAAQVTVPPSAPSPAPVAPAPSVAVPNGPAPNRPRGDASAPFNPSLASAPPPAPRVPAAPVVAPSRPAAPVAAEPASQPVDVRVDTRDAQLSPSEAEKVLAQARQQAEEIIARAREEAAKLRQGAEHYADQILAQLETDIGRTLAVIKNGRSHLQTRTRARRAPERLGERSAEATAT